MNDELLREEERKMRRLRIIIDCTQSVLMQSDLGLQESISITEHAKKAALALFPDKESVFNLIYVPRFRRIIEERYFIQGTCSGKN
ncbi:MAG: hypothetical protein JSV13_03030 [Nitrospiraceae bacterium]|nr:MAG: hypothetical protein JSV13_03030 [Nitrospiraceae bacterium]